MYFFGYSNEKPHVQYSVADEAGVIIHKVGFNLREPIMMHDFAVTQDYAVWMDVPLCYRPQVRVCSLILDCTITPIWRVYAIPGELCMGGSQEITSGLRNTAPIMPIIVASWLGVLRAEAGSMACAVAGFPRIYQLLSAQQPAKWAGLCCRGTRSSAGPCAA